MGFGQGLSGLNAASQNLDVIGNNIANSGTVGFKAGSATFADVYASSRVGLGVQFTGVSQRFTTGNITSSGGELDMAIDGPKGFFRVVDTSGAVMYTRNGQFFKDKDHNIVNIQGHQLTGYQGGAVGTDPVPLVVPVENIAPRATTTLTASKLTLDANASVVPATPVFDADDASTYTKAEQRTVYDSLGNAHNMKLYFAKRDAAGGNSVWDVYPYLGSDPMTPASFQMTFNNEGTLLSGGNQTLTFATPGGTTSPAAPLSIATNFNNATQFGGEASANLLQDGYATGEYASVSVDRDGTIVAKYTNDQNRVIGILALADFNNLQGLQPRGGNAWVETSASGPANLGQPGTNGLAVIKGSSIEESNVDMSQELVNMIIAQRTYQANAQTIKTQDQIMQTLVTMR
ncbi:flagellar hook protein FlgE [Corticimicrobacter populi]|uniref:Flagellar hook protein FlgE n=1 Tax=Corticimicrobacter populi TaxID=2175229 RepID=A0A2V1JVY7_9BURK|nr:flagellar hook protein FlgE [Corticimicrobacter populi]PWF21193.1 flagellar hook protein FlgE [Corticimicrobacter populi]